MSEIFEKTWKLLDEPGVTVYVASSDEYMRTVEIVTMDQSLIW